MFIRARIRNENYVIIKMIDINCTGNETLKEVLNLVQTSREGKLYPNLIALNTEYFPNAKEKTIYEHGYINNSYFDFIYNKSI